MSTIVHEIIKDCVSDGLNLPRDPISNNVLAESIIKYNKCGKVTFDQWPWDNRKIVWTAYTADADHIITLASNVDIVRGVKPVAADASEGRALWPQDEINAAINGDTVGEQRFIALPDNDDGNRRIQVYADDTASTHSVLCFKRFIEACVDDDYDADAPTATPTDYRVATWDIDHAEQALKAWISDELRKWRGVKPDNDWSGLLQAAIDKVQRQKPFQQVTYPDSPMFDGLGEFD